MIKAFLLKANLPALLVAVSRQMEVIAPLAMPGGPVYATWQGEALDLEGRALSPPTELLLPHKEVLFHYVQESGRYSFREEEAPPRLLFFIRPCDLHAIAVLDRIFGRPPSDQAYFRRRRATALVVANCTVPGEECFCASLGSGPEVKDACDLQITDLGDGYLCEAETAAGVLILNAGSGLLGPVLPSHLQEKRRLIEQAGQAMPKMTADRIRESMKKADWEALGRQCLSCGGCTFVCPVCHCFSTLDLGIPDGERQRCRDTCILSGFSRLTGGANPRRTPAQRLQHWYQDKFEDIPQVTGLLGCVGCGRCHLTCPSAMDRTELKVALRLNQDHQNHQNQKHENQNNKNQNLWLSSPAADLPGGREART